MTAPPGVFWIASYPKSGNTWTRCLIDSLSRGGGEIDLNRLGDQYPNTARRAWIEEHLEIDTGNFLPEEMMAARIAASLAHGAATASPPCLKIHDRNDPRLFPPEATRGIVYITRDPRDIAPSWARHLTNTDLDKAIAVMADPTFTLSRANRYHVQTPQCLDSWSGHVTSWLDAPPGELLLLRYEDMLAEPQRNVARLAEFLSIDADDSVIAATVAACRFETLQDVEAKTGRFFERPAHVDRFFRQGKSGTWRSSLSRAQAARIVDDHGEVMGRLGYL